MKTFVQIGIEIGRLVREKSEAYGDSLAVTGDFLRLLWPNGIPPERYDDAFLMARLFDKQMRFATSKDAFGESPLVDAAGYCIRGIQLHQHKKENSPSCPGSVSSAVAKSSSREQHDSAVSFTAEMTRTSESATIASAPSQPQRSSSAPSRAVSAQTAMATANVSADVHRRNRNAIEACAFCGYYYGHIVSRWCQMIGAMPFTYCSEKCAIADRPEVTA